jgi:hypothetical protein
MSSTQSSELALKYHDTNVEDGIASPDGWNIHSFSRDGSNDYKVVAAFSPRAAPIA